ncbi:MAG: glycosyltransferase [Myxococcota bacterium]
MSAIGSDAPLLSVIVTCTTAGDHVDRCLDALRAQRGAPAFEVIVPVDPSLPDVERWRAKYPEVAFPVLAAEGLAEASDPGLRHLAYDRRRATGLAAARGALLALTEDHARPAPDWCARIADAHARLPHAAIGGAIDNASPQPLAWAVYFGDFGRYQSPLPEGPADYVSDVNVSYKRAPLEAVADAWRGAYHETAVHGALRARGEVLWREPSIVVVQERGRLRLAPCLRERFAWGRLYAGKRAHEVGPARRLALALLSPLLPPLLLFRQVRTAWQRGRHRAAFARALPWLAVLLVAWSAGEVAGLWTGRPTSARPPADADERVREPRA